MAQEGPRHVWDKFRQLGFALSVVYSLILIAKIMQKLSHEITLIYGTQSFITVFRRARHLSVFWAG